MREVTQAEMEKVRSQIGGGAKFENTIVRNLCWLCDKPSYLIVEDFDDFQGIRAWIKGMNIADALPDASLAIRETLISGSHSACWDTLKDEDN